MPPKPFNPPRPTSHAPLSGSKPRGRPKGSTSTTSTSNKRKSTNTLDKPPKAKSNGTSKTKAKEKERDSVGGFARPRVSNASTVLDIDSEEVDDGEEEDDVEMNDAAEEDPEDEDPFSSQPVRRKSTSNPKPQNDEPVTLLSPRQTTIPPDLINVLLHGFFNHDNTRLSKDANTAVGRYIETFVREGLTRAVYAKRFGWEGNGGLDGIGEGVGGGGDGGAYLEVEDLERLAPQLILDF